MEPLSSFAINLAAGIVLELCKTPNSSVKKELDAAFKHALQQWSKNSTIRDKSEHKLKEALKRYCQNPIDFKEKEYKDHELSTFFECFQTQIANKNNQSAYNYLKEIKDESRYQAINDKLTVLIQKAGETKQNDDYDPRKISNLLDHLPFEKGKEMVIEVIHEQYKDYKIELKEKEILKDVVEKIYDREKELQEEIKSLRTEGNNELADSIEKIKNAVSNRQPRTLVHVFEKYKEQEKKDKQNKIKLIQELIDSSASIFAYDETIKFYRELIELNPSAVNHYNFAYYFRQLKCFDEAFVQYQKALEIFEELAKENPKTYLRYVAISLLDIGLLHSNKKEFSQALEKYEKALQINRDFAKDNPKTYLPEVAITLSHIATLHYYKNESQLALEKFEEALQIYRELVKENPKPHLPYFTETLNNYGLFLIGIYEFPQAFTIYEEALKISRELAQENPNKYLLRVAVILTNLATLHLVKKEHSEALEKFEEALKIKRNLAKENPKSYLPDVALTLNNFGNLHLDKKEFSQAFEKYNEALQINRDFAKENPQTYMPEVAKTLRRLGALHLNMNEYQLAFEVYLDEAFKIEREFDPESTQNYALDTALRLIKEVDLFNGSKKNLRRAKRILKKYKNNSRAQELLGKIKELKK